MEGATRVAIFPERDGDCLLGMLFLAPLVGTSLLLGGGPPAFVGPPMAPPAIVQAAPANVLAPRSLGTTTLTADILDDLEAQEKAKDAAINAKKAAIRKQQEEVEAKAQRDLEAKEKREEEQKAKIAAQLAKVEEAKAARAAAAQAAAEAQAVKNPSGKAVSAGAEPKKTSKYSVQTINKQADRIAARQAAGEDKPSLGFSFGQ